MCYDECRIYETSKSLAQHIQKTYYSKSLVFSGDENNFIFTIGIDPVKKFEVVIRLEYENTDSYIELNTSETKQLFNLLHQNLISNITRPTIEEVEERKHNSISVKLYQHNTYKLCVNDRNIFITLKGMLKLLEVESFIEILIKSYEIRAVQFGNTVFKLLKICCEQLRKKNDHKTYYGSYKMNHTEKAIVLGHNIRQLLKDVNLSDILNELLRSPCDCLSSMFIIYTKIHFEKLLSLWIAAYYETRLLSEAIRIESFNKKNWPHKFIDIQKLAKNGFFYVGSFDRVQCVFCKLILQEWKANETPIGEHEKYSPSCPLLLNKCEDNIPLDTY